MTHRDFPYRLIILVCGIFLFTRLYRITASLEFFADIGRDHYVLMRAIQTLKPPLLGPSTSALPISQSPIYYFLNLPVFLLSGFSPYTTLWTLIILFVLAGALGMWILRQKPFQQSLYLAVWTLGIFHPQLLAQTRYPWNPTYAFPFLMVVSAWMLSGQLRKGSVWCIALCLAIALGCTYSVLPVVIVILIALLRWHPSWRRELLIAMSVSLVIVFAPIAIVDLRSHFLISRSVLTALHETRPVSPIMSRVSILLSGLTGIEQVSALKTSILFVPVLISWTMARNRKNKSEREREHLRWGSLFGIAFLLTVLLPVQMQAHYLFGLLLLFFLVLVSMHRGLLVVTLCLCAWYWLPSLFAQLQFVPRRTVEQIASCARTVCAAEHTPLYLSEQAWHSYHFAPEYLFFFNKYGCLARDVIQDPGVVTRMGVIVDQSSFDPNTTKYAELSAFGPATPGKYYQCDGNIQVVMLEKKL